MATPPTASMSGGRMAVVRVILMLTWKRRAAARLFHVNMRITRTTAILPPLMEAVGGVAMVGALFYGSAAIRSGRLTTGAFTSFLAALFAMYTPVKRLSRLNATLQ